MSVVVFIDPLQPADSKRDALIGPLREFAESINADPECGWQRRPNRERRGRVRRAPRRGAAG